MNMNPDQPIYAELIPVSDVRAPDVQIPEVIVLVVLWSNDDQSFHCVDNKLSAVMDSIREAGTPEGVRGIFCIGDPSIQTWSIIEYQWDSVDDLRKMFVCQRTSR